MKEYQLKEYQDCLNYYLELQQEFSYPVPGIEKWIKIYSKRIEVLQAALAESTQDSESSYSSPQLGTFSF